MSLLVSLRPALGPALVVGGGKVAARKVAGLLAAGFEVRIVAPDILDDLRASAAIVSQRQFSAGDLDGVALVYACTDDRELNRRIGRLCREASIPVNVVDARDECTFFSLAVLTNGEVSVGVSTNGADPARAARIRDQIASAIGASPSEEDVP